MWVSMVEMESMSRMNCAKEFQSWGAQGPTAQAPIEDRRAEGWAEEEHRERGVYRWKRLQR